VGGVGEGVAHVDITGSRRDQLAILALVHLQDEEGLTLIVVVVV